MTILILFFFGLPLRASADADDGYPAYGWGMGPGMMGGYGMGPGMMGYGGWGNGTGMMGYGGWGMGPGMMGGYGMGPGMMGYGSWGAGPFGALNLSSEQREKISKIQEVHRKSQWETMGKIMDEQGQLNELYAADNPDAKKIGAAYGRVAKLQQQMAEAGVDSWNRMQAVLTKEQKEQLNQFHRGGWGPRGGGYGSGAGNMPGPGMMQR